MNKEVKEILEICEEFLQIPSLISYEQVFLSYLDNKIKDLGYETLLTKDYLVVNPHKKSNYLFSAHIDRHGIIKNEKGEFEHLAFHLRNKLQLGFKRDYLDFFEINALRYLKENITSVDENTGESINEYTCDRYSVVFDEKLITYELDKNPSEKEKLFTLSKKLHVKEESFYGQIDNVISAAALFYLLKTTTCNEQVIFTTKEEIGKSFENVLDYVNKENTSKLIVLDTTPYKNFKGKEEGFLVLRKGDENGSFDETLGLEIEEFLKLQNIPFTYKPSDNGMTELGRISSESNGKINGTTLQIPTTNYHTSSESTTLKSLENYFKVIKKLSS